MGITGLSKESGNPKNDVGPEPKVLRTHIDVNVIGHQKAREE
jgi:hypothetical protein